MFPLLARTKLFLAYLACALLTFAAPADHLIGGIPQTDEGVQVIERIGYLAGYSQQARNPAWVAYRLRGAPAFRTAPRPGQFLDDPSVHGEPRHRDYTHSGYDRGHLASNAVIGSYFGPAAQRETFYMTNILPQTPQLNRRGVWRQIEQLEMGMGAAFQEVWVITGAIDTDRSNRMPSGVSIPEGSFKIIVDQQPGTQALRVAAFAFPQDPQSPQLSAYAVSVDRVEQLTGLDFFPDLPASFESVERARPGTQWITAAGTERRESYALAAASKTPPRPAGGGSYWISSTGKTHRSGCRYFATGNGAYAGASGVNCKLCGGAR